MFRFLPWKFIVQRAARAYGFADPALWLARIRNFAQPSEVQEPIELVRAGVLFHARGIVNAKAIQHNLDWVWPYWVERQFDPDDISFIPRAFSFSHINLTHRNWTAVGLPELPIYPIVDPRGLVTPLHDGWSIDFWLLDADGKALVPSRLHDDAVHAAACDRRRGWRSRPRRTQGDLALEQSASRRRATMASPCWRSTCGHRARRGGSLVRGDSAVQPRRRAVHRSHRGPRRRRRLVRQRPDGSHRPIGRPISCSYPTTQAATCSTWLARVRVRPRRGAERLHADVHCKVGMATAAAVYRFDGPQTELTVRVPLDERAGGAGQPAAVRPGGHLAGGSRRSGRAAACRTSDCSFLYDAAVQTLVLLSADEVVPGPYTYRRFWFRDACLMMNALLAIGLTERCRRAIERFPAAAAAQRLLPLAGRRVGFQRPGAVDPRPLRAAHRRAACRVAARRGRQGRRLDRPQARAGRQRRAARRPAAGRIQRGAPGAERPLLLGRLLGRGRAAGGRADFHARRPTRRRRECAPRLADEMRQAIERSIERIPPSRSLGGIPASPYRRIDAGAIGSLVADYPLQLFPPARAADHGDGRGAAANAVSTTAASFRTSSTRASTPT